MTVLFFLLAFAVSASAQDFTYRGFGQVKGTVYPQTVPPDDRRFAVEARFRFEPAYKPVDWLTLAGSIDARADNFDQVEREWRLDVRDRTVKRQAFALRHAEAMFRKRTLAVDVGKQFIRWGKTDILNPTDRFAPRDLLEVIEDEFIAVTGVRVQYERGPHSLDGAWTPAFTPSRAPLSGRRWLPLPPESGAAIGFLDLPPLLPEGSQYGVRWNVLAPWLEFSLSYFDGFNHLPVFTARPLSGRPLIALQRTYAPLRMAGGDAAIPLPWFTIKAEMASLSTTSDIADDVVLYVVQLERQTGELSLVGGYAGEIVTERRSTFDFAPDRGLTRAFLGRVGYTLSALSDISVEGAVRQDFDGVWIKGQYSRAVRAHWRVTLAGAVIGGRDGDFIGQYRRNSHLIATLRYSF